MAQKHYERFMPTTDAATVVTPVAAAATDAVGAAATTVAAAVAAIAPKVRNDLIHYPQVAFSDPARAKVIAAAMTAKRQIDDYREYNYGLMKHIIFPHIEHLKSLACYCLSRENRPIDDEDLAFILSKVTRYERDGQIGVKEFINWINWIDKMREMIDNLWNMFYETTFHGYYLLNSFRMTSTDAEKILEGSPAFTFVLRWSHSSIDYLVGCLAVSYIKEDGKLSHLLISYEDGKWAIKEEGKAQPELYPCLKELIKGCKVFEVFAGKYPKEENFPKVCMAPSLHECNQIMAAKAAAMASFAADSP